MLPTEIIARAETILRRGPSAQGAGRDSDFYQNALRELGGNNRSNIEHVFRVFDFERYNWFKETFGETDEAYLSRQMQGAAAEELVPVGHLKVLDLGTANARVIYIMSKIVREIDPVNINHFLRAVRGCELVGEVVHTTRKKVEKGLGMPKKSIFQGDFLDLSRKHRQGEYDLVTAMMRTLWHITTEKEWVVFLKGVAEALRVGGRLVFDTVRITEFDPTSEDAKAKGPLHDLGNLYNLAWLKYCNEMDKKLQALLQKVLPPETAIPSLRDLPRHAVRDHAIGMKTAECTREIASPDFIKLLCERHRIPLEQSDMTDVTFIPDRMTEVERVKRGRDWLTSNELLETVDAEVEARMSSLGVEGVGSTEASRDYIARKIAKARNRYMTFVRTK